MSACELGKKKCCEWYDGQCR